MNLMMIIFTESVVAACIAGILCGYLGVYLSRLRLITLGFAVAHGAIAGASIAFLLGLNVELLSFIFGVLAALMIEYLHKRFDVERDIASMYVFSFSSAIAIIAIYMTPTLLLTSDIASMILWGSILAMTMEKIVFLATILSILVAYTRIFKWELNSILFDRKLAEAEGVNTSLHTVAFVLISAATISILLRFVGGLLLFSLIFGPAVAATSVTYKRQNAVGALIGSSSGILGVIISFYFDLPIGSMIAISVCIISVSASMVINVYFRRKLRSTLSEY